jgi:2-polyprenyl-3-methyl-5-hydroxy-6-metoxy-1,4-benzoquinol methylase
MKKNGAWSKDEAKFHQVSPKLAEWLSNYLPKEDVVIDFGCGNGYYMGYLETEEFDTIGIDGNSELDILCTYFIKHDLSEPIDLKEKGTVISFETMEHIPKEFEHIAVDNLINHCKSILIMSWASVGQPGIGHINCQNKDYVVALFEGKGFELLEDDTAEIRKNVDENCSWFERNLLILKKL